MEMILILCVPLMIGGMWGVWQARSHRFSFAVLLTAPLVSATLIGVGIAIMTMLDPPGPVMARPLGERTRSVWRPAACMGRGSVSSGPSQRSWVAQGLNCSYFGRLFALRAVGGGEAGTSKRFRPNQALQQTGHAIDGFFEVQSR